MHHDEIRRQIEEDGEFADLELLGIGATATVFRATNVPLSRVEVLKVLVKPDDPSLVDRLKDEARIIAGLDHPQIQRIFALGERENIIFYCKQDDHHAQPLRETISSHGTQGIPINLALSITLDVAAALHYAHTRTDEQGRPMPVVHRDVKPDNILLTNDGRVLMTDYGIAARQQQGLAITSHSNTGTTSYMAPEQFTGEAADPRSDVYSLGIVLFEMLTGKKPFHRHEGITPAELESEQLSFPAYFSPDRGLEALIRQATKTDPEERTQTAEELRSHITKYKSRKRIKKLVRWGLAVGITATLGVLANSWNEKRIAQREHEQTLDYVIERIGDTPFTDEEALRPLLQQFLFRACDEHVRGLVESKSITPGKFPYAISTDGTEWSTTNGTNWSDGHWPGMLWLSYAVTGKKEFKDWATQWADSMQIARGNPTIQTQDEQTLNAYRFFCSHTSADATDQELSETALEGATLLMKRFNEDGSFFQTIPGPLSVSPNHLLYANSLRIVPYLHWAYDQTGDETYLEAIVAHADAVADLNIQADNSTLGVVNFSTSPGGERTFVGGVQYFGYSGTSCFARDQAWTIMGFAEAYRAIGDERYLRLAEQAGNYFIGNLPEDGVPFYDFKDPRQEIPKDSSAAAIGASALLDLYDITSKSIYKRTAFSILHKLCTTYHPEAATHQGLLLHGCSNVNKSNADASLIYGDAHLLGALHKIKK